MNHVYGPREDIDADFIEQLNQRFGDEDLSPTLAGQVAGVLTHNGIPFVENADPDDGPTFLAVVESLPLALWCRPIDIEELETVNRHGKQGVTMEACPDWQAALAAIEYLAGEMRKSKARVAGRDGMN